LKPENILFLDHAQGNVEIKVSDFGFSCFVDPNVGLREICGTSYYMGPELVPEDNEHDV